MAKKKQTRTENELFYVRGYTLPQLERLYRGTIFNRAYQGFEASTHDSLESVEQKEWLWSGRNKRVKTLKNPDQSVFYGTSFDFQCNNVFLDSCWFTPFYAYATGFFDDVEKAGFRWKGNADRKVTQKDVREFSKILYGQASTIRRFLEMAKDKWKFCWRDPKGILKPKKYYEEDDGEWGSSSWNAKECAEHARPLIEAESIFNRAYEEIQKRIPSLEVRTELLENWPEKIMLPFFGVTLRARGFEIPKKGKPKFLDKTYSKPSSFDLVLSGLGRANATVLKGDQVLEQIAKDHGDFYVTCAERLVEAGKENDRNK